MADRSNSSILGDALQHLLRAIALLDAADAPGNIAAHADLAAQQLKELIVAPDTGRFTRPGEVHAAWRAILTF